MTDLVAAPAAGADAPPLGLVARLRFLGLASGVYLLADALARGLSILLVPLYTRFLTPSDYGALAIATAVISMLAILLGLALHGALSRMHFEARSEDERRSLYGTLLVFLVVVPGAVVVSLEVLGRAGFLDVFADLPYDPYLRYVVWTAYLAVFVEIPLAIYTVREQPRKVVPLTLLNAGLLAAFMLVFVVALEQAVLGALRAMLLAAGSMAILAVFLTARNASRHVSRRLLAASLAFSLPLVPHLVAQWILHVSDRIVLERFVSARDLGLYSLGASVATAGFLAVNALNRAFTPAITLHLKDRETRRQVPALGTWWVVALTWALTALAVFGGDAIRLVTPASYHGAARVVPWIAFGFLAFGLYTVVTQGTWFSMRTRMIPVFTVVAGVVNVGLNIVLIPRFGFVAAGWTTLIAFAVLAVLQGWHARRLHRIDWEYVRWLKALAAGAACFGVATTFAGTDTTAGSVVIEAALMTFAFPAMLTVLGFWTREERRRLRSAAQSAWASARPWS